MEKYNKTLVKHWAFLLRLTKGPVKTFMGFNIITAEDVLAHTWRDQHTSMRSFPGSFV